MSRIWYIVISILLLCVGFGLGRYTKAVDTVTVRDTVIHTITDKQPVSVSEKYVNSIPYIYCVRDTVRDTVYIPIVQKEYIGDSYHAWVSGYSANLDSIQVKERIITNTITIKDKKRWNIGVQCGYGMTVKGLSPYIGLGITYRIY